MNKAVACLLLLSTVYALSYAANIAAEKVNGFEVIFLDEPGWLHDFHYSWQTNKFYAYGQSTFRQIDHAPGDGPFAAVDNQTISLRYNQPFIDVRLFSTPGQSDLWMVGPSYNTMQIGYFLPVTFAGPNEAMTFQGLKKGYTFYGVSVDARNFSHVIVYLAGWIPGGVAGTDVDYVSFGIVRAHIDLTIPVPAQRNLVWDDNTDVVILYHNDFHPYHATTKPQLIHDYNTDRIYVVDTNQVTIFSVTAPRDGVAPMVKGVSVAFPPRYGRIAGSTWHYYNDIIYVGFAGKGRSNSTLVSVDLTSMSILREFNFPIPYSNPRAIAGRNSTLFIGFEGGPSIIKFDVNTWQIVGIQRLPEYLHQVYSAWDAGFDHIYFSTYEQHSKVFRLDKLDFCGKECPYNGYCDKQICKCNTGYQMTSDGNKCEIPPEIIKERFEDSAAAIALGILFAIAFVAAIIGWVLFYRKNKDGYARVL